MLPLGVYPLTRIEQEKNPATQVIQLVSLLEFLLGFVSPGLMGKDGRPATVGERVDVNRTLFSHPPDVFFGIGVRNNIVHAKATDATEVEIRRAVSHLFNAIGEIRTHVNIPQDVRQEIFAAAPKSISDAPTKPVTTLPLPPAPQFAPIYQAGETTSVASAPLPPASPLTTPINPATSYTTKVSPKSTIPQPTSPQPATMPTTMPTINAEPSISTRQIRNAAIFITVLAAAVFLAKPVWQFGKERLYGSETDTQITRGQAESALNRVQTLGKRQGSYAAKITEAQAAWRDADIAFKQQKFKDAETGYRRVLQISDELAVKDNERKEAQQFFDEMNKAREAARVAQAQQYAAAAWQDAENLRRSADAALKTGDTATAKQTSLQAQQKYEEAKSAADATPKPALVPTPTPASADPPSSGEAPRVRPRPESLV